MLLSQSALRAQQATYTLKPTPKTVAWGYYDAKAAPVLRAKSGDTVEIQTLITNSPKRLEDAGVPPDQVELSLRDITELVDGNKGIHMMLPKSIFVSGSPK
jgi:acetamidase/formamidase